ncbi:MAG TPA: SDR family NAD(P)-dependent oxidoreductase [Candidatus Dormibacteraeota bacterium]
MGGRAVVTGATGFLGRAIVEHLVAAGRPVRALVRSDGAAQAVSALGAEPVRGDLRHPATLEAAFADCDAVYHAAGMNAFCLPDPRPLYEVNVVGSRAVALAAAGAGVGRLIYTSSAVTMEPQRAGVNRREFPSEYARSKLEAERAVMQVAEQTGLTVVCVNPASVQGPGRTSGTARLLIGYLNGRLPVAVNGPLNVVDVADCTRGHILAEEQGVGGERYLLCGASMTLREGLELLARITGLEDAPRFLPAWLAYALAAGVEAAGRARNRRSSFCREMVRTLTEGSPYDGTKAMRDLGLVYTPIEASMRRTIGWYVEQGLIHRPLPGFSASRGDETGLRVRTP